MIVVVFRGGGLGVGECFGVREDAESSTGPYSVLGGDWRCRACGGLPAGIC